MSGIKLCTSRKVRRGSEQGFAKYASKGENMNDTKTIVEVDFTPEYYERFAKHCERENVSPRELIAQLIAMELDPPNVVWGPWKPAA